jgi:hypothetical protein
MSEARNPAWEWFLAEENQDYLISVYEGMYVAIFEMENGFGVAAADEEITALLRIFYAEYGEVEPVYFGYVGLETPTPIPPRIYGEEV